MSAQQKRSSLAFLLILLAVAVIIFVPKLVRVKNGETTQETPVLPSTPEQRAETLARMNEITGGPVKPLTPQERAEIERIMIERDKEFDNAQAD